MSATSPAITEEPSPKAHQRGIFMVLTGAALWGCSGVSAQYLFHHCGFSPEWLVMVRMLLSGALLLIIDYLRSGDIFSIWHEAKDAISLLLFGILGMLAVQYTYFVTIQYSNAATATVLQYLMPIIIVVWGALRNLALPRLREVIAVISAIAGTFILTTHGNMEQLVISQTALIWGITSAFAGAFYTVQPKKLLRSYRASLVVGWGMIAGGLFAAPFCPWSFSGTWDSYAPWVFAFIIIFGTVLAFSLYLGSIRYIQPGEAGTLASVEPLSAIIFSSLLLSVPFTPMDLIGSLLIVGTVFIVSR